MPWDRRWYERDGVMYLPVGNTRPHLSVGPGPDQLYKCRLLSYYHTWHVCVLAVEKLRLARIPVLPPRAQLSNQPPSATHDQLSLF